MTDQIFYEELRATIRDAIASYLDTYTDEELRELATESLNLPSRPTLADMTDEERAACRWMQADVADEETRAVIVNPFWEDGIARVMWPGGFIEPTDWEKIAPRWGVDAEWWETGVPGCDYAPHTIIHAGKKADQ